MVVNLTKENPLMHRVTTYALTSAMLLFVSHVKYITQDRENLNQ